MSKIIHVRWSGEAVWIPLGDLQFGIGYEDATSYPAPGQIILFPGGISETEILIAYGPTCFASKAGQLAGNHFLTIISNFLNNQKLTDAHTCYKAFHRDVFDLINLEENDFAFCPEVNSKVANLGYEIHEVPINYNGRDYKEGKKIKTIDAFRALKALIKYR